MVETVSFRFPQGYAAVGAIIDRFLEAILHSTSTFFCGIPTGSCRQNRYIWKQCSAYGADLFTPHLPQAASSPQAPQGEDNRVRRKTQQRTDVWRGTRGFLRSPEPGNRKTQQRTTGLRSSYGFHQCPEPGNRNNRIRRCSNSPLKILNCGENVI